MEDEPQVCKSFELSAFKTQGSRDISNNQKVESNLQASVSQKRPEDQKFQFLGEWYPNPQLLDSQNSETSEFHFMGKTFDNMPAEEINFHPVN